MEYNDDKFIEQPDHLLIDEEMKSYLDEYGRWGKILAIISFVGIGLGVVAVIVGFLFMSTAGGSFGTSFFTNPGLFIVFFYMIIFLLYLLPVLYLYRSSTSAREAVRLDDDFALVNSFRNLKNLFKFLTIFLLVSMGLYVLMVIGALFSGAGSLLGL